MTRPEESTHDRLNRELRRMHLRDRSRWAGWAVLFASVGTFVFFSLNTPVNTRYVSDVAGQVMSMPTEDKIILLMRVSVDGRTYDLRLPSQLVHPAVGDTVCLRASERRFTGHTTYHNVSPVLCDRTNTTPDVN